MSERTTGPILPVIPQLPPVSRCRCCGHPAEPYWKPWWTKLNSNLVAFEDMTPSGCDAFCDPARHVRDEESMRGAFLSAIKRAGLARHGHNKDWEENPAPWLSMVRRIPTRHMADGDLCGACAAAARRS